MRYTFNRNFADEKFYSLGNARNIQVEFQPKKENGISFPRRYASHVDIGPKAAFKRSRANVTLQHTGNPIAD